MPDSATVVMAELAELLREGLLAVAVGAGLQVMAALMEEDVVGVCGRRAAMIRVRCGTGPRLGR
jgi:hypothetical protein